MEPAQTTEQVLTFQLLLIHGLMAFFGALVHASSAHRKGQSKTMLDFVLLTLMSSFSGIVFALIAFQLFDNPYMTLAVTGAGGFLGVEGLTVLATNLRDVITNMAAKK